MHLPQFCKNKLQAQYSFTYWAQYIAKKYMRFYIFLCVLNMQRKRDE